MDTLKTTHGKNGVPPLPRMPSKFYVIVEHGQPLASYAASRFVDAVELSGLVGVIVDLWWVEARDAGAARLPSVYTKGEVLALAQPIQEIITGIMLNVVEREIHEREVDQRCEFTNEILVKGGGDA